ncbi:MAG: hypothetical protein RMJ97_09840 [Raineya sp.]|nr:hypothetical protein [Raineya sp.]MDW8297166.1 hypothetical protein [Raineya sp.]
MRTLQNRLAAVPQRPPQKAKIRETTQQPPKKYKERNKIRVD